MVALGSLLYEQGRKGEAEQWRQNAATAGHPGAMFKLGSLLDQQGQEARGSPATSPHLRRAWAPLTFTGQNPPGQDNPVTQARRSATAQAKASGQHDPAGQPYHSFRGLLEHLITLTRNQVRYVGTQVTIPMLAEPTSTQREAFPPDRRPDPADAEVARTPPGHPGKTPGQARNRLPSQP